MCSRVFVFSHWCLVLSGCMLSVLGCPGRARAPAEDQQGPTEQNRMYLYVSLCISSHSAFFSFLTCPSLLLGRALRRFSLSAMPSVLPLFRGVRAFQSCFCHVLFSHTHALLGLQSFVPCAVYFELANRQNRRQGLPVDEKTVSFCALAVCRRR